MMRVMTDQDGRVLISIPAGEHPQMCSILSSYVLIEGNDRITDPAQTTKLLLLVLLFLLNPTFKIG
jgi:hypothetical protein